MTKTKRTITRKPTVSLRDYFIAAALTGLCAAQRLPESKEDIEHTTRLAREIADEMLIERER